MAHGKKNPVGEQGLNEYIDEHEDKGCKYYPACETCPFKKCVKDEAAAFAREVKRAVKGFIELKDVKILMKQVKKSIMKFIKKTVVK